MKCDNCTKEIIGKPHPYRDMEQGYGVVDGFHCCEECSAIQFGEKLASDRTIQMNIKKRMNLVKMALEIRDNMVAVIKSYKAYMPTNDHKNAIDNIDAAITRLQEMKKQILK